MKIETDSTFTIFFFFLELIILTVEYYSISSTVLVIILFKLRCSSLYLKNKHPDSVPKPF